MQFLQLGNNFSKLFTPLSIVAGSIGVLIQDDPSALIVLVGNKDLSENTASSEDRCRFCSPVVADAVDAPFLSTSAQSGSFGLWFFARRQILTYKTLTEAVCFGFSVKDLAQIGLVRSWMNGGSEFRFRFSIDVPQLFYSRVVSLRLKFNFDFVFLFSSIMTGCHGLYLYVLITNSSLMDLSYWALSPRRIFWPALIKASLLIKLDTPFRHLSTSLLLASSIWWFVKG